MLAAAKEAAMRVRRERDDAQVARILSESVAEDRALQGERERAILDL